MDKVTEERRELYLDLVAKNEAKKENKELQKENV